MRTAIEYGAGRALAPLLPKLRYFGDYELLEEIARGGMGVVYRARQVSLDRIVAVKMMRPGVLATEDEIRRFQAEARTAASMQHPNIVAIHEVGEFDGLHYFSMDFVEGPSLAELVRQKPLAPKEAARYVQVLAEAVHYAHGKGILHRDLKPSNVLVDAAGRPRITDFGLARPMEGGSGMTVAGTLVGTPAYMPPEQAAAEGATLTAAADCYSLGAILYELLAGRPPFQAASPVTTVRMVLEEKPAGLRTLDAGISPDLEAICLQCLEKDPTRRYQSAADLAADLERFLRGEAVLARRLPFWRPRLWYAGAAAALILAAFGLAVLRTRPPAPVPTLRPGPPGDHVAVNPAPPPAAPPLAVTKSAPKTVTVPRAVPAGLSVTPYSGSGARQTFTFRYSEPAGASPIAAELEFRDTKSGRVCRIFAEPDADYVGLQFDPAKGPGLRVAGRPGGFSALENTVCAIDLTGLAYTHRDHVLEIRIPMTFKESFMGPKEVYSWPLDGKSGIQLESRIRGEWTVM